MENELTQAEEESSVGRDLSDDALQQIADGYAARLKLPPKRPVRIVICPVGLVGSGKTTVAKVLTERLGLIRVSSDEIRLLLRERGNNFQRVQELGERVLKRFAEQGYSLIIDSDCVTRYSQVEGMVAKTGFKPIWIHIATPEKIILERLRNYRDHWLFSSPEEALENYYRRKPLHAKLDIPFLFVFDTSRDDFAAQLDQATALIENVSA